MKLKTKIQLFKRRRKLKAQLKKSMPIIAAAVGVLIIVLAWSFLTQRGYIGKYQASL